MSLYIIILTIVSLASVFFLLMMNLSVAKKPLRELDFRPVASQLIALAIWIILIFVIMPSSENEANSPIFVLIFVASVVVGLLLIRSISHELRAENTIRNLVSRMHKNNSRLRVLDKQKTEFVSLASHQLRGPVSVIRGYASMLTEGDFGNLSEKQQVAVERILRSSEALGFLISDYLEVTRIEKGEMEYVIEDVNISQLMSSLAEEFSGMAEKNNLNLSFMCAEGTGNMIVRGDKGKLRQIFSNLIDNAIKYTKEGDIRVKCEPGDEGVTVSIKDTGIGIEPERMNEIFSKFLRTKEAKKMNVIGTGLGLFLAKVMTEAQDGKIWAKSEGLGKGSTFCVWFPVKD